MTVIDQPHMADAIASAVEGAHFVTTNLANPTTEIIVAGALTNFINAILERAPDATAEDIRDALSAYARDRSQRR
jgi:hypothetical protein